MTPRQGNTSEYPVLVASKYRPYLAHARLDVRLRLRIRAKRHTKGVYLSPEDPGDVEAIAWIREQVALHGTFHWTRTGWVKKLSKKDKT